MKLRIKTERFSLRNAFAISRGSRTEAVVVTVEVEHDGSRGRGECVPYARYGESVESVCASIGSLRTPLDREDLQSMLPPGAARNAVDCALWDLEAKQSNTPVWKLAGLSEPKALETAYTLSLGSPDAMKDNAEASADLPLLKVKLGGGSEDAARIAAVRKGAPKARLIVDANEAWKSEDLPELIEMLSVLDVEMVEQPLPADNDAALAAYQSALPICADESCHGLKSFEALCDGYAMINIKLDKTGGLTEALKLKARALSEGYQIMVGCMIGTSLAMAPAVLLAQGAKIVDLDGPLLLAEDRELPLRYEGSRVFPSEPSLWG